MWFMKDGAGAKQSAPDKAGAPDPPVSFDLGASNPKETRWVPVNKGAVFQ